MKYSHPKLIKKPSDILNKNKASGLNSLNISHLHGDGNLGIGQIQN